MKRFFTKKYSINRIFVWFIMLLVILETWMLFAWGGIETVEMQKLTEENSKIAEVIEVNTALAEENTNIREANRKFEETNKQLGELCLKYCPPGSVINLNQ